MAPPTYTTSTNEIIRPRQELGRGGEGTVYEVAGGNGLVAKIYHPTHRTREREWKLRTMLASPPQDDTRRLSPPHISIAWPVDVLYERKAFAGFLMPRIHQCPTVFQIYNPQLRQRNPLSLDWRHLHHIAKNLATALNALHARGYVMGDVNQKNILVTSNALVTLVDTDSFQVSDHAQGRTYRCSVGVPEYTPPELQGVDLRSMDREPYHDCFGLAVIVFQLLMEGFHPFTGAPKNPTHSLPGEVYLQCIKQGIFPYQSNRYFGPPPSAPEFAALHPGMQQVFIRCFVDGHKAPSARPTAREWIDALGIAEKGLIQCPKNKSHWHSNHASNCHWCELEKKKPLPVQQPLAAPAINRATWQPQKALVGTSPAQQPAAPPRPRPAPVTPLLGMLVVAIAGAALIRFLSPYLSYIPYSPKSYLSWNDGPIAWGRALGGLAGLIAGIILPIKFAKDEWQSLLGRILACIFLVPIGAGVGDLMGLCAGMLAALVITGLLPVLLGIALGLAGGSLLAIIVGRYTHRDEMLAGCWLGVLAGGITSAIAWGTENKFLANTLFVTVFAWAGYGGANALNGSLSGVPALQKPYVRWLVLAYFGLFILGTFAPPAILGVLVAAGLVAVALLTIQNRTWQHALAGVGCVVAPLIGAWLGNCGNGIVANMRDHLEASRAASRYAVDREGTQDSRKDALDPKRFNSASDYLTYGITLYKRGEKTRATEILREVTQKYPASSEASRARQIMGPLQPGRVNSHIPPFEFKGTWPFARIVGPVWITPLYADIEAERFTLVFQLRASDSGTTFMWPYENRQGRSPFESTWEALYVVDDNGRKLHMISYKVEGAEPKEFNGCDPIMNLELSPRQVVQFSVTFPIVSEGATFVSFHSPTLNGWQSEFSIKSICLEDLDLTEATRQPEAKAGAGSLQKAFVRAMRMMPGTSGPTAQPSRAANIGAQKPKSVPGWPPPSDFLRPAVNVPPPPPSKESRPETRFEFRTWTSGSGKFKIRAKFRGVEDGKAKLEKEDGRVILVPLDRLSEDDQRFIDAAQR